MVSGFDAGAQSQALNGQIEGTVLDETGAVVPRTVVAVTNIETGATRSVSTDESGVFRFPLVPLGAYRITAEAANFKKLVREGITLTTGQTATVNLNLEAGEVQQTVTVSLDASVADSGKIDLGRVMNTREVQSIPNIPRNPFNFGLLQANVTGRPSRGYPFPSINVNGYARRVQYLIDGNTNTQGDRGSIRFMIISDTYVSEVQLLTNGFAAEFGNTPGMIMNVVTPSGTNTLHGALSYRFRRPSFYSRPFFFPAAELPDNKTDNFRATVGGQIIKDRWHFYLGYENGIRDDKAAAERLVTIREEDKARLITAGLPASIFPPAIPSLERGPFYIFRTDLQLNEWNRLTARLNYSSVRSENFIPGRLNTSERSTDAAAINSSLATQLVSYTPRLVNEFRFQYADRGGSQGVGTRNEFSGQSPAITITGVANFGSTANLGENNPVTRITQFQDNLTQTFGSHSVKFGGGLRIHNHNNRSDISSIYTFASIDDYIAARNGVDPRSYANYTETFGDPDFEYGADLWNLYIQDDWKLTRRLKLSYGLRYDLYRIPRADPAAPFEPSRRFNVDKNNFAPRLGIVYSVREGRRPTILRLGAGVYYDQPLLQMYQRALQANGNPTFFNVSFSPGALNAPAFPNTFSGSLPSGSVTNQGRNIDTIAPDFVNMYAMHSNIQLEQGLSENLSFAIGYVHSAGRHLPVYRNINLVAIRFLADGRPVFSRTPFPGSRFDARFNNILMVESVGVSRYDALTLQLTKRFAGALQFSANYTLSDSADDAPEQNLTTADIQGLILSDPFNRRLDRGTSFANQRHTFVMTLVASPRFTVQNRVFNYLFNNNQIGIIATANSGETFNIISATDINGDGAIISDRPVGITRNSGKTPPVFNVDMRYSRFFNLNERYKLEVFGDFQNLFNINSIVGFTNVTVPTDSFTGEMIGPLPDFRARNQSISQESRQFQLGFRFIF